MILNLREHAHLQQEKNAALGLEIAQRKENFLKENYAVLKSLEQNADRLQRPYAFLEKTKFILLTAAEILEIYMTQAK